MTAPPTILIAGDEQRLVDLVALGPSAMAGRLP